MAPEIVVTAWDVTAFGAAPGNPHLIYDGATVRVVPRVSVERDYPAAFVITTREDLLKIDPRRRVLSGGIPRRAADGFR